MKLGTKQWIALGAMIGLGLIIWYVADRINEPILLDSESSNSRSITQNANEPTDSTPAHIITSDIHQIITPTTTSAALTPAPLADADDAPTTGGWLILSGRVTLKATGAPASGADVWLSKMAMTDYYYTESPLARTVADADGRYEFRLADDPFLMVGADFPGAARDAAFVMLKGYDLRSGDVITTGTRRVTKDLALEPAAPLSGSVVDALDKPIAGARLLAVIYRPPDPDTGRPSYFRCDAVSGPAGEFNIPNTRDGSIRLVAQAEGYVEHQQQVTAPQSGLLIRMSTEGGIFRGVVFDYDTRQPAAGAVIQLTRASTDQNFLAPLSATANALGEFEFIRLAPARYQIAAAVPHRFIMPHPDLPEGHVIVKAGESRPPIELWLYGGHTIKGTVLDALSRAPLADVAVKPDIGKDHSAVTTGADGRFLLMGVRATAGYANLTLSKPGYRQALDSAYRFTVVHFTPERLEETVTLYMNPAVKLSGRVIAEDGSPISGARVNVMSVDTWNEAPVKQPVNQAGEFDLETSPFKGARVRAEADGFAPRASETIDVKDKDIGGIEITLTKGGTAEGVVVDPDGRPVEGAIVDAHTYFNLGGYGQYEKFAEVATDISGAFTLTRLPPYHLTLSAKKSGYAPAADQRANLKDSSHVTGIKFQLRDSLTVEGRVTDAAGATVADVQVTFISSDSGFDVSVTTDDKGLFTAVGLAKEIFNIHISHPDYTREYFWDYPVSGEFIELAFKEFKTGQIIGRVVDAATQKALTDFTVTTDDATLQISRDPDQPGDFQVTGLKQHYLYQLTIKANGYLDIKELIGWDEEPSTLEKTFLMGQGGTITGRCAARSESGTLEPAADVTILLQPMEEWMRRNNQPLAHVKTDAEGRFRLGNVAAGSFNVNIVPASPYIALNRTAHVRHGETTALGDIELGRGATLTGRLVQMPGEAPIPGVPIVIVIQSIGQRVGEAKTDDDGRFTITGLPNDGYRVYDTKYHTHQDVRLEPNGSLDITLRVGGGALKGLVLRGGQPAQAWIRLRQESLDRGTHWQQTDMEGRFEITNLPPGTWTADVIDPNNDRVRFSEIIEITANDVTEHTFEFPSGRLWGRVVGADDRGVAGAQVIARLQAAHYVHDTEESLATEGKSGDDGGFEITGLQGGLYAVTASHPDHGLKLVEGMEVPAGGVSSEIVLKLDGQGGTLVSIAVAKMDSTKHPFRAGDPIPEAWCNLTTESSAPFEHGRKRGADGRLTIPNLPPGKYAMEVSWFGYSINERMIEIKAGETLEVRDELYNAGALRFALEEADGHAVVGAACHIAPIDPQNPERAREGRTDITGLWIVRGLWPGKYLVTAETPEGRGAQVELAITAHELTEHRETLK